MSRENDAEEGTPPATPPPVGTPIISADIVAAMIEAAVDSRLEPLVVRCEKLEQEVQKVSRLEQEVADLKAELAGRGVPAGFGWPAAFRHESDGRKKSREAAGSPSGSAGMYTPPQYRHVVDEDYQAYAKLSQPQGRGGDQNQPLVSSEPGVDDMHRGRMLVHVRDSGYNGTPKGTGWSEPPGRTFRVRGPDYIQSAMKYDSPPPLLVLSRVDFAAVEEHMPHIAAQPASAAALRLRPSAADSLLGYDGTSSGDDPFASVAGGLDGFAPKILCVQFLMPNHSLVFWFVQRRPFRPNHAAEALAEKMLAYTNNTTPGAGSGQDDSSSSGEGRPGGVPSATATAAAAATTTAAAPGSLAWKVSRFKMIPNIEEGGYVVKKVVGTRPALIGKDPALTQFYSGENYLEVSQSDDLFLSR